MRLTTPTRDTVEVFTVNIFTDGSCQPNPGRGGWGALIRERGVEREMSGFEEQSTNNKMELTAAIVALESLVPGSRVVLYTDSQYVRDGITAWIDNWKRRKWTTRAGEPVKNADLWRRLDAVRLLHRVRWVWVRGHDGHAGNERADALAVAARREGRGRV